MKLMKKYICRKYEMMMLFMVTKMTCIGIDVDIDIES